MPFRLDNIGNEITVSPAVVDIQSNIKIAALADGGYVVLWDSWQQDGLRAQRYDADGMVVGSEISVTSIYLSGRGPAVAGLEGGGFVVSWGDVSQATNLPFVRSQIYDANGAAVGAPINGTTDPLFSSLSSVNVISLDSGGFLVVHDRPLRGRIYDAAGVPQGNEFTIDIEGAYTQGSVSATELTSGHLAIAWQEGSGFGLNNYRVRLFDAAGVALGAEMSLGTIANNLVFPVTTPGITALTGGGFVVTWSQTTPAGQDSMAQLFNATGVKVGGEFVLNTTLSGDQTYPRIAALANGGFVAGWTDYSGLSLDRSNSAVILQTFDANGQKMGDEHLVNNDHIGFQYLAQLAVLADGDIVVSWGIGSGSGIRTQIVRLAEVNVIGGTASGETLNGTAAPDDISGFDGDDIISGGNGRDVLLGGLGSDQLQGDAGDDRLEGGDGVDLLNGGAGSDILLGGDGNDVLTISAGDDLADGGAGDDTINSSGSGIVRLYGGDGNDTIWLGNSVPVPVGDTLLPSTLVFGGGGQDSVTITGSFEGSVRLALGSEADTITLQGRSPFGSSSLLLTFSDFNPGAGGDSFDFIGFLLGAALDWDEHTNPFLSGHLRLEQAGTNTLLFYYKFLDLGATLLATFENTQASSFIAANFAGADRNFTAPAGLTITGTPDPDTLQGGHGDDTIFGLAQNDTITGGAGNDTIDGGEGDDSIRGQVGNDVFVTSGGVDTIYGGDGNDVFTILGGLSGGDSLHGDAGADRYILLGVVAGTSVWGDRDDTLVVTASQLGLAASPMSIDFSPGQFNFLGMMFTSIGHAEVEGGSAADSIVASTNYMNSLYGLTARGGWGADTIVGSWYADTIYGDDGDDMLSGSGAISSYAGDLIYGGAGNDTIVGSSGNDEFDGGTGSDSMEGFGGNDVYIVDDVGDSVTEGAFSGIDTVRTSLPNYTLVANVENLTFTGSGVASLAGNSLDNLISIAAAANGSNINGGGGTDTLAISGAVTLGTLAGLEAIDLIGGATLTLTAAQFNTGFYNPIAQVGMATVSGSGVLVFNIDPTPTGAALSLTGLSFVGGSSVTVTINGTSGIDAVKGALTVSNTITGGDGADQIRGGNQADTINGGNGNDKLFGWGGVDVLTGGAGSDQFRYFFATDSGTGAAADRITDFEIGIDKFNFTLIDADPNTVGDQAFAFLGTGAFTAGGTGQIRHQNSGADLLLLVDVDGNGTVDMEVVLQGLAGSALTSADFML